MHINVPLVEALAQMPHNAKLVKELLTNKRKLEKVPTMTLSEECSAILTNKLPMKDRTLGDLLSFVQLEELLMRRHLLILGRVSTSNQTIFFKYWGLERQSPQR